MTKAMELLRKLTTRSAAPAPVESAFDLRLKKMGGVRPVSVSRAVLFRTRPAPQEA